MKTILVLLILFSAIALPALGELTTEDLEKIREIVKASETELKSDIDNANSELKSDIDNANSKLDAIDTRLRTVETGVAELRGRNIGFSAVQDWIVAICAVAAIVLSIIALRRAQPKVPPTAQDTSKVVSQ